MTAYADRFSEQPGARFVADRPPARSTKEGTSMTAPPAVVPEVGAPTNKAVVNSQLGTAAQTFKKGLDGLVNLFEWAEPYDATALQAIGFTEEEANLLKSGLAEVPAIDDAVSATQFLKRFWGAV